MDKYQWNSFDGNYEKHLQDIRLKDGTEIEMCWPNAGFFICLKREQKQPIPAKEVAHVKFRKWNEN